MMFANGSFEFRSGGDQRARIMIRVADLLGLDADRARAIASRAAQLAAMTDSTVSNAELWAALVHEARMFGRPDRVPVGVRQWLPVFDQHGRHTKPVDPWSESPGLSADRLRALITESAATLPFEHRVMYVLRDSLGLSAVEAAMAAGHDGHTAGQLLHEARLAMRAMLAPRFTGHSECFVG